MVSWQGRCTHGRRDHLSRDNILASMTNYNIFIEDVDIGWPTFIFIILAYLLLGHAHINCDNSLQALSTLALRSESWKRYIAADLRLSLTQHRNLRCGMTDHVSLTVLTHLINPSPSAS